MSRYGANRTGGSQLWQIYATGLVVCAGLSAASYFFGIRPALAGHVVYQADLAELEARRRTASELVNTLTAATRTLEQTRKEVERLPLRLESSRAVNTRLARLANLAAEVGLAIDEIQPGATADAAHYQTVPIRIGGQGTYPACAAFLHQLRQRFPDTAVRSFDASNNNPTPDHPTGGFVVELVWYTEPARK